MLTYLLVLFFVFPVAVCSTQSELFFRLLLKNAVRGVQIAAYLRLSLVSLCCKAVAIFCFHVSVGCFDLSFAVAEIIEDTKRVTMISARWNLAVGPMLMMGGAFVTVVGLTLLGERNAPKPQDEVSLPSRQRKL